MRFRFKLHSKCFFAVVDSKVLLIKSKSLFILTGPTSIWSVHGMLRSVVLCTVLPCDSKISNLAKIDSPRLVNQSNKRTTFKILLQMKLTWVHPCFICIKIRTTCIAMTFSTKFSCALLLLTFIRLPKAEHHDDYIAEDLGGILYLTHFQIPVDKFCVHRLMGVIHSHGRKLSLYFLVGQAQKKAYVISFSVLLLTMTFIWFNFCHRFGKKSFMQFGRFIEQLFIIWLLSFPFRLLKTGMLSVRLQYVRLIL